jgi:hypothetical protein
MKSVGFNVTQLSCRIEQNDLAGFTMNQLLKEKIPFLADI